MKFNTASDPEQSNTAFFIQKFAEIQ